MTALDMRNGRSAVPVTPIPRTAARRGRVPRAFPALRRGPGAGTGRSDLVIAEAGRVFPGNPCTVQTLPGGHSPFATRPGGLATLAP